LSSFWPPDHSIRRSFQPLSKSVKFSHDAIWGSLVQEYYQLIGVSRPEPSMLQRLSACLAVDTENTSHINPLA